MTIIKAETILSSQRINTPHRLTTMLLTYPRCIHAEFMTHRVFSRNAASSRAIPVARLLQDVIDHPFIPLHWGLNQPGMQATAESHPRVWVPEENGDIPESGYWFDAEKEWLKDRDEVVAQCHRWIKAGYHKQIINRKLEPYAHIKVLVTGDPRVVNSCDLLLPFSGESAGAAERETEHDTIEHRLKTSDMYARLIELGGKDEDFAWYLDAHRDKDIPLHSGCGIGMARVAQFILGQPDIRQSVPFLMNKDNLL